MSDTSSPESGENVTEPDGDLDATSVTSRDRPLRVVVVDDDDYSAHGVATDLEALGLEVVAELRRVDEIDGDVQGSEMAPDVICCDVRLDTTGTAYRGPAGVCHLAELGYRVLAMSTNATPIEVGDAIGSGALGYLEKRRNDPAALAAAVETIGEGRQHCSRALARALLADLRIRPLGAHEELDDSARRLLEQAFDAGGAEMVASHPTEIAAGLQRIWSVWAKRSARHRLELTERQERIVELTVFGADVDTIAKTIGMTSTRTVQVEQDKLKMLLYSTYGIDLPRDRACRRIAALRSGELPAGAL